MGCDKLESIYMFPDVDLDDLSTSMSLKPGAEVTFPQESLKRQPPYTVLMAAFADSLTVPVIIL